MSTEVPNLQVSITLVSLHQECLQGNFSRLQQLKQHVNSGAQRLAKSQQEAVRCIAPVSAYMFVCACSLLLSFQPVYSHVPAAFWLTPATGFSGVKWHCSVCTSVFINDLVQKSKALTWCFFKFSSSDVRLAGGQRWHRRTW